MYIYTHVKELGGRSPRTAAEVPNKVLSLARGVKGRFVWTVLTLLRWAMAAVMPPTPDVSPLMDISFLASFMICAEVFLVGSA